MNWSNAPSNNTAYSFDQFQRLTGIAVNNTPVYGYTLNAKDQRTAATLPDGKTWDYSYDGMGQVTGGVKKTAAGATIDTLAYAYDTIGNRTSFTENGTTRAYTSNNVNQYTALTNPAMSPTYDADGNMLTNSAWSYTWNAENRLICAQTATVKEEYSYDYMGRRWQVKNYTKSGVEWVLNSEKRFIYDGFKQIAEYTSSAMTSMTVWQPESSGDFDVPLWFKQGTQVYTLLPDGNKNIRRVLDASGNIVANYDYSPFGEVTASGALMQPWQFSSEHFDSATGLVYYNYRYYSPELGRWIKRDPIEEQGGVNLYGIVGNKTTNILDILGFDAIAGATVMDKDFNKLKEDAVKEKRGLYALTRALQDNKNILNKYNCTFIIAAAADDGKIGESKFVPSQVIRQVKDILKSFFSEKCLNIVQIEFTSSSLVEALRKKCICGLIYIGHAGTDPSRIIFDQETDSIAAIGQSQLTQRKPYTILPKENMLPGNTSAIFGCNTAVGGENSIAGILSKHFQGTVIGANGGINFDGGDPYSPWIWGFSIYNNSKLIQEKAIEECCCKGGR